MNKQLKTAFTLIELLIVIGVIAILSAGIIIGVRDATRAARETAALVFSTTMKKTMITDMVGEWTFDDETNPGYDSSGKGNNGTLVGPPTWTADGKVRGALEFNGGGDYVSVADDDSLDITDEITIEVWVKHAVVYTGSYSNHHVVHKSHLNYRFASNPAALVERREVELYIGGSVVYTDTNIMNDCMWHHITATFDDASDAVKLYIDGENKKTQTGFTAHLDPTNSDSLRVGDSNFNGTLDEVRIYDAALQASQIKARYVEGLNKLHADGKLDNKEYYQRLTETGF